MNIDNINKTIDFIRTDTSRKFDMDSWGFESSPEDEDYCGTACCIAGYAVALKTMETGNDVSRGYRRQGRDYLDLTDDESLELFIPHNPRAYDATKEQGIQVLEILRDTGKVDWDSVVGVWTGE